MCATYCHSGACCLCELQPAVVWWRLSEGAGVELQGSSGSATPIFAQPLPTSLSPLVPLPFTHFLVSQIPVTAGLALGFSFGLLATSSHLADTRRLDLHSCCSFPTWAGPCPYCHHWVFFLTAGAALPCSCSAFIAIIWLIPSFYLFTLSTK